MAVSSITDRLSLDAVILRRGEETIGICLGKNIVDSSCGIVGLLSNKELDVL